MNELEHLLACVGEECGEVQQTVGKMLRFGMTDINRTNRTNYEEFIIEMHDLIAVYELVICEHNKIENFDRAIIERKKAKVNKYMRYAKEIGQIT